MRARIRETETRTRNTDDRDRARRQTEGAGRALSNLCEAWMHVGAGFIVGSTRALADSFEDLSDNYCAPRSGRRYTEKSSRDRG